jgi:hypothetical protein
MGLHNPEFAALVGQIITDLPHVEERMISFMALLLGDVSAPAQQVFRSLHSEDSRVKVMRVLLEKSKINQDKGQEFDDLLDLFVEVKKRRNALAHGLWSTHSSGRVFLAEPTTDEFHSFITQREIKKTELTHTLNRIDALNKLAFQIIYPDGRIPSPKKLPP